MVKRELVAARLEKLREYLKVLKGIQKYGLKRFKEDALIRGAGERYLQLSIECLLDIGSHIISDRNYRKPETYTEIHQVLFEQGVIPESIFRELEGMAAFRNILVHDYVKLDVDRAYDIIQTKLKYIQELASVYAELL